jgi:ABC-type transporter Mla subunit MlaD
MEMERRGVDYRFVATLGLRNDIVLWRGTKGVVTARMMGGPFLDLRLPPADQRRVPLQPGEPIEGESGASTGTLVVELTDLTRNLSQTVAELRQELKTRGLASVLDQPQVRRTFQEVGATLGSFDKASKAAEDTFARGRTTLEGMDRNMLSLEKTLAVLEDLTRRRGPEMDAIIEQLGPALKQVQTAGSDLSALLKDAGPEAEESLKALRRTLQSTQELVEILKAKPNRLVFGTPSEKEREAARKRAEESAKSGAEAKRPE